MTADNMLNMVDATATRSTTIAACPAERVGRTTVNSLPTLLALNRTVGIVLISILFLWPRRAALESVPSAYLGAKTSAAGTELVGGVSFAALLAVGMYACLRNLFEAACYVGGGQLTARLGDRGSLIVFGLLTVSGYALFLVSTTAPALAIVATSLILGWEPLSIPVTFTTVGMTVTRTNQGMAFALQSIQKRLPRIIGPAIAGVVLAAAAQFHGDADMGPL